jgi:hypothetical protein
MRTKLYCWKWGLQLLLILVSQALAMFGQELPRCPTDTPVGGFQHEWSASTWAELAADNQSASADIYEFGIIDSKIRNRLAEQGKEIPSLAKDAVPYWPWSGDFSHGRFAGLDLRYTMPIGADFTASDFFASNLEHVHFRFLVFPKASEYTHEACVLYPLLNGAFLMNTKLAEADLGGADLAHVVFEPSTLPDARTLASARNLDLLTYGSEPTALVGMRKALADSGFQYQARQVNYALKRRENEIELLSCCPSCQPSWPLNTVNPLVYSSHISSRALELLNGHQYGELAKHCLIYMANRVGLDLTCQYGLNSARPIEIGIAIWLICSFIFLAFIHHPGSSGLYIICADGIEVDPNADKGVVPIKAGPVHGWRAVVRREVVLIRQAMFFSLMNGINLGFKEIDLGRWLRLLPRRELDIKAVGWARTVAGIQALCTLYLVVLWILVTFASSLN